MVNEPGTLYKLMSLYMLKRVNFPLTNSQITDFFVSHEYTSLLNLQQVLSELIDAGLIDVESIHNTYRYSITSEGSDTLDFFKKNIPSAVLEDIDGFLKENRFKIRNEAGTTADYYQSTNHDYIVHCEVLEGKSVLIGIDLSVPDEMQAQYICENWKNKSSDIYSNIIKSLLSDG